MTWDQILVVVVTSMVSAGVTGLFSSMGTVKVLNVKIEHITNMLTRTDARMDKHADRIRTLEIERKLPCNVNGK